MFADAQAYERFMGRWSRLAAPRFVSFAGVADSPSVLDVGCGTGALSAELGAHNRKALIMGLDRSREYIAFASQQNKNERIRYEAGDAQRMTYPNDTFDATLSMLVLNFIPQAQQVVAEMRRVTKPKGRIAAAVWDYGDGMQMLRFFWDAAVGLDPAADKLDEKHMPLCRSGELSELFSRAGIVRVSEKPIEFEMRFDSFEDYWQPFLLGQGPSGAYVKTLSEEKLEALRNAVRRRLANSSSGSSYRLTAKMWAVRGERAA